MCLLNESLNAKVDKWFDKRHPEQWWYYINVQTADDKLNTSSHMYTHVWRFLHNCIKHIRELLISEHFFDIPTGSFKYPRDDFLQGNRCSGNLLSEIFDWWEGVTKNSHDAHPRAIVSVNINRNLHDEKRKHAWVVVKILWRVQTPQ